MSKYTFYNCILYTGMIIFLSTLIYLACTIISLVFGMLISAVIMVLYGLLKRGEYEISVDEVNDSVNKAIQLLNNKKITALAWDGNLTELEQILYELKEMLNENKEMEG